MENNLKRSFIKIFQHILIPLLCGVGVSFIQSPTEYWFLILPFFSIFYTCFFNCNNKKQIFGIGFLFAFGYSVAGLYWIGNALLVEGNDSFLWAWPLAVLALPTLLALFTALYLTFSFILFKNKGLMGFFGFCAALLVTEWVRGHVFTGFPWNLYGYGWIGLLEIAQISYWVGPYGLTALTIFWGAISGLVWISYIKKPDDIARRHVIAISVLAVITFALAYGVGHVRLQSDIAFHDTVSVHIVQPNIAQKDKWDPKKYDENLNKIIALSNIKPSKQDEKNIIIWPETAYFVEPFSRSYFDTNRRPLSRIIWPEKGDTILLTGMLDFPLRVHPDKRKIYNSLALFRAQDYDITQIYSKSHLVPFGEYIPFQRYIPLKPVTDFTGIERGDGSTTIKINDFPSFSPKICYEIIFPHKMIQGDQEEPAYILTITNDAWYGDSPGPYQHFTQARFRAIENGVPVIRAANTGVSGVIDPYGRVIANLPLMQAGVISHPLPLSISQGK